MLLGSSAPTTKDFNQKIKELQKYANSLGESYGLNALGWFSRHLLRLVKNCRGFLTELTIV